MKKLAGLALFAPMCLGVAYLPKLIIILAILFLSPGLSTTTLLIVVLLAFLFGFDLLL